MIAHATDLPVSHPRDLAVQRDDDQWLIRGLWGKSAVGILGGAPKVCKTWLALDMAVSVATGTPALQHFEVEEKGLSLVFLAEDALPIVRKRIEALCSYRGLDLSAIDVLVITTPVLRLDLEGDQQRLFATVKRLRPKMLLLDPLVRLHRLDENSATEISGLLGYIREIQRAFDVAVMLVHHASKKQRSDPGQALRGSGDLHAFGDSNAYLARKGDDLVLTVEHRAAKAMDPILLRLVTNAAGEDAHLEVKNGAALFGAGPRSLDADVIGALSAVTVPVTRAALREQLQVNNQRLGETLVRLEAGCRIRRTNEGWIAAEGVDPG